MTKVTESQTYDIELLCQVLKTSGKRLSRLGLSVLADKDRQYVDARAPLLEIHPNVVVDYTISPSLVYYKWVK